MKSLPKPILPLICLICLWSCLLLTACSQENATSTIEKDPPVQTKEIKVLGSEYLTTVEYFRDSNLNVNCYLSQNPAADEHGGRKLSCTYSLTGLETAPAKTQKFPVITEDGVVQRLKTEENSDVCYVYWSKASNQYSSDTSMSCLTVPTKDIHDAVSIKVKNILVKNSVKI